MKAFIARSEQLETWLQTEHFCPHCGSPRVWVNEEELLGGKDEQYICIGCGWMFAMPLARGIAENETELFALLEELREAIKFPRKVFGARLK